MRVRLLSDDQPIREFLEVCGDEIVEGDGDWLVSFGHREIIAPDELAKYPGRAINLHIGAIPWNRGAHPNYWAWRQGTPHGVTLHWLTSHLDGGPIIAQRRLSFGPGYTYRTSYMRLIHEARALFTEYWPELRIDRGSYHKKADLPSGLDWDTSCV